VLILACGNRQRGDDAAGILVAEKLRALGVEVKICEPSALLDTWAGADNLILIDTVVTGCPPGTMHVWDGPPPRKSKGVTSTHGFGIMDAIELARIMDRLPVRVRVYGIEGHNFALGDEASEAVRRGVEEVVRNILFNLQGKQQIGPHQPAR